MWKIFAIAAQLPEHFSDDQVEFLFWKTVFSVEQPSFINTINKAQDHLRKHRPLLCEKIYEDIECGIESYRR